MLVDGEKYKLLKGFLRYAVVISESGRTLVDLALSFGNFNNKILIEERTLHSVET